MICLDPPPEGSKLTTLNGDVYEYQRGSWSELKECSGVTAQWCPNHGACMCSEPWASMDDPGCPLHGGRSLHGRFTNG